MELSELNERIKGNPSGRYIFGGEEDYLKRYYASELVRAALGDSDDIFSHSVFDGDDVDFGAVREAIVSPAMMSEYKVIEWRFADFNSMKEKELVLLEEISALQAENPDTVLIFTAASDGLDFSETKTPSKLERRLAKSFDLINFKKSTDRQLLGWLKRHFDAEGIKVDADTLGALISRSGRVMDVLINEVHKLCALAKMRGADSITGNDVREVASTTPESETFALQNAITGRDRHAAFQALEDLKFRRIDPNVILAMTERCFSELLSVAMMQKDGEASKIEEVLGLRGFRQKLAFQGAARYGSEKLAAITEELARIDASSKFGGISGYKLIEIFFAKWL